MSRAFRVALMGNPNVGKTTLFNALTGLRHRATNYPGTTVETREGRLRDAEEDIVVVDFPGVYSLSASSDEERIARRELLNGPFDLVVQVVDATNAERNLYLTTQLLELGVPLLLAFNMSDRARALGIEYDLDRISTSIGAAIVPTVGHRGEGIQELVAAIRHALQSPLQVRNPVHYGADLDAAVAAIEEKLAAHGLRGPRARWLALKLLENDPELCAEWERQPDVMEELRRQHQRLLVLGRDTPDVLIADRRLGLVAGIVRAAQRRTAAVRRTWSDRLDEVLAHPVLGVPVFLAVLYVLFWVTFRLADPPMRAFEWAFEHVADAVRDYWPTQGSTLLRDLIADGILGGVGSVVSFLPNIALLFAGISILEDSGYLARAVLLSDRLMQKVGLHGRSFVPLLIGFGCNIPALMATRVLESRRDRLTTMMVVPLIACGARFTVFSLLIPAFFPEPWRAPLLWGLYVLGILLAVGGAWLLRHTLFRGEPEPLIVELPPYRMPTLRGILVHMWDRCLAYLQKAGTIILALSVILWFLTTFPRPTVRAAAESESAAGRAPTIESTYAGRLGRAMEPILRPMGFDARLGSAMIGALAAREVLIAQLGIVFAVEGDKENPRPLREHLQEAYSPLVGFCLALFMLISPSCLATVAVMWRESGSWKWTGVQFAALYALAWGVTTLVYQIGRSLGL